MIRWTICRPGAIKICAQAEVALVGGGNSAGQAAVFLAQYAAKVFMLVRRPSLAASMSRYLIDRIDATPNIELRPHTQLTQLHGGLPGGLAAVSWRDHQRGIEEERPIGHVFLFVGAEPETGWLEGCGVALDSHGFVLTGQPTADRAAEHLPASLESSVPGVFAVGDVRRAARPSARAVANRSRAARGACGLCSSRRVGSRVAGSFISIAPRRTSKPATSRMRSCTSARTSATLIARTSCAPCARRPPNPSDRSCQPASACGARAGKPRWVRILVITEGCTTVHQRKGRGSLKTRPSISSSRFWRRRALLGLLLAS